MKSFSNTIKDVIIKIKMDIGLNSCLYYWLL
jgi:hypothetical protein